MKGLLGLILLALLAIPCAADAILVNWDGSGDYTTIQAAIDNASDLDIVIVAEGTYFENISFGGRDIILTSSDPYDLNVVAATVIDGGGADTVATFDGTETSDCELLGLSLIHI